MSDLFQNTNPFVDQLREGLSLIDEDDFQRRQAQREDARLQKIQRYISKGLHEIELNENDFYILDKINIVDYLPPSFFNSFKYSHYEFTRNSLCELQKNNPSLASTFLKHLSNGEYMFDIDEDCDAEGCVYEPIEKTLDRFREGSQEDKTNIAIELEDCFMNQYEIWKIRIIKTILLEKSVDRDWWYRILGFVWWDDSLIIDIEKAWNAFKEPDCARVIINRFPIDYVRSHQDILGGIDYFLLCRRLVKYEGFIIDKKRLSKKHYYEIMGTNYVHLDNTEADNLLFGHVLQYLRPDYKPEKYAIDISDVHGSASAYDINYIYNKYQEYYWLAERYSPTLFYLPDILFYIETLIRTGNTKTVVKFIVWDKYIRRYLPSYNEYNTKFITDDNYLEVRKRRPLTEYLDWSWEQLIEKAIENFPIKREDITNEFEEENDGV